MSEPNPTSDLDVDFQSVLTGVQAVYSQHHGELVVRLATSEALVRKLHGRLQETEARAQAAEAARDANDHDVAQLRSMVVGADETTQRVVEERDALQAEVDRLQTELEEATAPVDDAPGQAAEGDGTDTDGEAPTARR